MPCQESGGRKTGLMRKVKIGLALGSGAARGWSHIGVINALNQMGITVDIVAGVLNRIACRLRLRVREASGARDVGALLQLLGRAASDGPLLAAWWTAARRTRL